MLWPPGRPTGGRAPIPARAAETLDASGAALLARHESAVARQRQVALRRAFTRRHEALSRRVAAVEGDLAKLERAEGLEKVAQLLVAQAGRVPRGAHSAVLDDWESGGKLEVTLDPARPAMAQAEAMFAKVRRARRGRRFASERLEASRAELCALEALRAEVLAGAGDIDAAVEKRARAMGVKLPDAQALARRGRSTAAALAHRSTCSWAAASAPSSSGAVGRTTTR
ncbi:MAG: NFACT family protein [Polyangiaceae bacterium]